jgi:hypothetical protein
MSAKFGIDGLAELRAELRRLPEDLQGEAAHFVEAEGNGAALDIRRAYGQHRRTGNLQERVTVMIERTKFGVSVEVKSADPIANIFEKGTEARHTDAGANRGVMPAGHAFIPPMVRARRRVNAFLRSLLERKGLLVIETD